MNAPIASLDEKYRQVFEQMDQAFCIIELQFDEQNRPLDYRFLVTNPVFAAQTGFRDAVGRSVRALQPDLEQHWFDVYGRVALTGEPARFVEGSAAMGRWFDVSAFRVGGPGSREVALLFNDVSDRRRAEISLQEKDSTLRALIQQAPVAIFLFRGADMIVETANSRALEMIKRTEDAVGKPLLEVVPELRGTPNYAVFEQVYHTGIAQEGREVLVPLERDGLLEDRYFNFTYTPLRENGRVVGVLDVATEVTDSVLARKKIEELVASRTQELADANAALQDSNRELLRSNQNLEEFAHAASHDLKEPVRKVRFFTQHLKEQLGGPADGAQLRSLERIESAAQRMGGLIDDLLQYSHVNHRPLQMDPVDLSDKVACVLEDLELDVQQKGAQVTVGPLPQVPGYGRQLQQLFQNLLSNALKYSKPDVAPRIGVMAEEAVRNGVRYACITVRDNGIGFAPEHGDKIFQMFTRLHHKHEYGGTGVGLSIVKKVVENHHGFIETESSPGQGATFRVFLPL